MTYLYLNSNMELLIFRYLMTLDFGTYLFKFQYGATNIRRKEEIITMIDDLNSNMELLILFYIA